MTTRIRGFEHDDLRFEVDDHGPIDGETVVLLHGFPQTSRSWETVRSLLNAGGYRTLTFDQRGYAPGARPRGRFAYRMSALVGDVVALVNEAGGHPVHLVGHDWGAAVSWTMAAQLPALVRTLTAVSVPHPHAFLRSMLSSNQALRSWYMAFFQIPGFSELVFRHFPSRARVILRETGMTREQLQRVQKDIVEGGALTGGINWYRAMPFAMPWTIGKVPVPTTYVWSEGDIALSRRCAELCERYVTGPYTFEALGGTHWIPEEQPERLTEIIVARARRAAAFN